MKTFIILLALTASLWSCKKDEFVSKTELRKVKISCMEKYTINNTLYEKGERVIIMQNNQYIIVEPFKPFQNAVYPVYIYIYTDKDKLIKEEKITELKEFFIE